MRKTLPDANASTAKPANPFTFPMNISLDFTARLYHATTRTAISYKRHHTRFTPTAPNQPSRLRFPPLCAPTPGKFFHSILDSHSNFLHNATMIRFFVRIP